MSTRTGLRPTVVIDEVSMGADIASTPTILQSLSRVSYEVVWSNGSTPVGTLSVQLSNDYALNPDGTHVANSGTWTSMYLNVNGTPSTTVSVSGNTGNVFIDIDGTAAYAIRLIYTRVSGDGTMTATIAGKVN